MIYDEIDYSGERPTIPAEKVENYPQSFIPPLEHYYKNPIPLSFHWDNSTKCMKCGRIECSTCFSYCPYCGGEFNE